MHPTLFCCTSMALHIVLQLKRRLLCQSQARTLPLMHVTSSNPPPGPINSTWRGRDEIERVRDDTSFGSGEPAQMEAGGEVYGWVPGGDHLPRLWASPQHPGHPFVG